MKFQGFRLTEEQIENLKKINGETGIPRSHLVRAGLDFIIGKYQKSKTILNQHLQDKEIGK